MEPQLFSRSLCALRLLLPPVPCSDPLSQPEFGPVAGELVGGGGAGRAAAGGDAHPGGEPPEPAGHDAHGGRADPARRGRRAAGAGVRRLRPARRGRRRGELLAASGGLLGFSHLLL